MTNATATIETQQKTIVIESTKNVGIAILLCFGLGPIGMFYSTVWGALIMLVLTTIVMVVTFGIGFALMWPISIIWGGLSAHLHNKKVLSKAV